MQLHALQIEEDLQKEVKQVEYALEGDLKSFGRGFTILEKVLLPCFTVCSTSQCHKGMHSKKLSFIIHVLEGYLGIPACTCAGAGCICDNEVIPVSQANLVLRVSYLAQWNQCRSQQRRGFALSRKGAEKQMPLFL